MEEVLDYLEEEGDGPLHLEGKGVAVKPDTDDEEALGEVLDREQGRTQQLLSTTIHINQISNRIHINIILSKPNPNST